MQKLTPEKVADYSFQIVVVNSMDYIYYLHEPDENEYLFMSVYPYRGKFISIFIIFLQQKIIYFTKFVNKQNNESFINSFLNDLIIYFIFTVPLIYIDASNDDGIGGADIIYQKEIIKKIPEKSGCLKNATIQSFVKCRKTSLKQFLEYAEGFAEGGVI